MEPMDIEEQKTQSSVNSTTAKTDFLLYCKCDSDEIKDFKSTVKHKILFDKENDPVDQWNENYVRLPCSDQNVNSKNQPLWPIIKNSLIDLSQRFQQDPKSKHIRTAILNYNQNCQNIWKFELLCHLIDSEINSDSVFRLRDLIPKIIKLALDLPNQIKCAIPLLKSSMNYSLTFTQEQCACLLANAFFCTFPMRDYYEQDYYENTTYPIINFNELYCAERTNPILNKAKIEKIKCILHYFKSITDSMPDGNVTFTRRYIDDNKFPNFEASNKKLRNVLVAHEKCIEDYDGALQVDFANKYIGGGVLNYGNVQEEIRFITCPEAIIAMLFCEKMNDNEAILIKGIERFSDFEGYGSEFKWKGDYKDNTPFDGCRRRQINLVAMDAIDFRTYTNQYEDLKIQREIKKAYCAFLSHNNPHTCSAVATGNWGCGAFEGDPQLKFLIQLVACSEAERGMIYTTFKDERAMLDFKKVYDLMQAKQFTCGELYKYLMKYSNCIKNAINKRPYNLFSYLWHKLNETN